MSSIRAASASCSAANLNSSMRAFLGNESTVFVTTACPPLFSQTFHLLSRRTPQHTNFMSCDFAIRILKSPKQDTPSSELNPPNCE